MNKTAFALHEIRRTSVLLFHSGVKAGGRKGKRGKESSYKDSSPAQLKS